MSKKKSSGVEMFFLIEISTQLISLIRLVNRRSNSIENKISDLSKVEADSSDLKAVSVKATGL